MTTPKFDWKMIGQFNKTFDNGQKLQIKKAIEKGLSPSQIDIFAKAIYSENQKSMLIGMIQDLFPDQLIELASNPAIDWQQMRAIRYFYIQKSMSITDIKSRVALWLLERD